MTNNQTKINFTFGKSGLESADTSIVSREVKREIPEFRYPPGVPKGAMPFFADSNREYLLGFLWKYNGDKNTVYSYCYYSEGDGLDIHEDAATAMVSLTTDYFIKKLMK